MPKKAFDYTVPEGCEEAFPGVTDARGALNALMLQYKEQVSAADLAAVQAKAQQNMMSLITEFKIVDGTTVNACTLGGTEIPLNIPPEEGFYLDGTTPPVWDLDAGTLTLATVHDETEAAGAPVVSDLGPFLAYIDAVVSAAIPDFQAADDETLTYDLATNTWIVDAPNDKTFLTYDPSTNTLTAQCRDEDGNSIGPPTVADLGFTMGPPVTVDPDDNSTLPAAPAAPYDKQCLYDADGNFVGAVDASGAHLIQKSEAVKVCPKGGGASADYNGEDLLQRGNVGAIAAPTLSHNPVKKSDTDNALYSTNGGLPIYPDVASFQAAAAASSPCPIRGKVIIDVVDGVDIPLPAPVNKDDELHIRFTSANEFDQAILDGPIDGRGRRRLTPHRLIEVSGRRMVRGRENLTLVGDGDGGRWCVDNYDNHQFYGGSATNGWREEEDGYVSQWISESGGIVNDDFVTSVPLPAAVINPSQMVGVAIDRNGASPAVGDPNNPQGAAFWTFTCYFGAHTSTDFFFGVRNAVGIPPVGFLGRVNIHVEGGILDHAAL